MTRQMTVYLAMDRGKANKGEERMQELLDAIKEWQVKTMGNTCTICYGNNAMSECSACGWWGRVQPEGPARAER